MYFNLKSSLDRFIGVVREDYGTSITYLKSSLDRFIVSKF